MIIQKTTINQPPNLPNVNSNYVEWLERYIICNVAVRLVARLFFFVIVVID